MRLTHGGIGCPMPPSHRSKGFRHAAHRPLTSRRVRRAARLRPAGTGAGRWRFNAFARRGDLCRCANLHHHRPGRGDPRRQPRARRGARITSRVRYRRRRRLPCARARGCELEFAASCSELGRLALTSGQEDRADAATHYARACEFDGSLCFLGEYLRDQAALTASCDAGPAAACAELARILDDKRYPLADDAMAVGYYDKACAGGVGAACLRLAHAARTSDILPGSPKR